MSAYERAASAVTVTGLTSAKAWSQSGMVETGTNTELAKTSGKTTTNPADWAASAPRTVSATKAKIQLSAKPKAATTATQASAPRTPPWKRKPTRYPTTNISAMITVLRNRSATVRPSSTAERAIGMERKRSTTPRFRSSASPMAVCVALKVTDCTKMPGSRKSTYSTPSGRAPLTAPPNT